jgi:RNA polymerase sigma-70 factor (ECF subfamily)
MTRRLQREAGGLTAPAAADDDAVLAALRRGDEAAFAALVARHAPAMLRVARLYLADVAGAEDAVQDAWMGVLRGLDRFEGRASLRTWIFRILLNRVRSRRRADRRLVPFSALFDAGHAPPEPAVAPGRFLDADHPRWPHHWREPPAPWPESPEARLLSAETRACVARAIAALPPAQREVVTLRDVEGWSARETCNLLGITETNQRVLLHRARARVRGALERHFRGEAG